MRGMEARRWEGEGGGWGQHREGGGGGAMGEEGPRASCEGSARRAHRRAPADSWAAIAAESPPQHLRQVWDRGSGGGGARWRGALRRWEVLGLDRLKIIARSFSCWKMRDLLQRASPPGVSADALLAIVRVCHGCCASSCVPGLCSKVSFLHDRFPDSDLVRRRRNFHGLRLV